MVALKFAKLLRMVIPGMCIYMRRTKDYLRHEIKE